MALAVNKGESEALVVVGSAFNSAEPGCVSPGLGAKSNAATTAAVLARKRPRLFEQPADLLLARIPVLGNPC